MSENILAFVRPEPKPTRSTWVGPIEAERLRCISVLTSAAAQGHWATAARTMLTETAESADYIIAFLMQERAGVRAEFEADIRSRTFCDITRRRQ
jgi:hypothetical protein